MFKNILWLALGGAIGTVGRYLLTQFIKNEPLPLATFVINIAGSLLIGMVLACCYKTHSSEPIRLFLATGLCGGFTTFSAFSYENLLLLQNGKYLTAILYILLSVILGIAATALGYKFVNS